eukprot:CAMPEP_0196657508 /NCGR_PEP_ID=MMETSP1086-20130531/23842_1 /TAXON_ID=77921 /ORGANISM="Cyanoptyche  gloeocystis , Strain SAG4.97" /LENGTH=359 /DNA_ID=CAMNT_0041990665 /DNA_START=75 /DNA_END=1154 /DNA_ORIENTATION=+
MICVDNSDWMRNGDYPPTRIEAQHDAVNLICGAKTQQNPENTVGIMTMAGKTEVLVTPTQDLGKILQSLHGLRPTGSADFAMAVQRAQLALKHRQNKNQRQRIIVFVGSPIGTDVQSLVRIGKKLKKNNVAVDIVNFGEEGENTEKLEAFLNAVNSNDNSHLITIPPGPHILSDILIESPVIAGDGEGGISAFAASAAAGVASASGFEFGVDPSTDPELALALRVSMEEERARQEAEAKKRAEEEAKKGQPSGAVEEGAVAAATPMAVDQEPSTPVRVPQPAAEGAMEDDESLLAQAIAMSIAEANEAAAASSAPPKDTDMIDFPEDEQVRIAIQMSMQAAQQQEDEKKEKEEQEKGAS